MRRVSSQQIERGAGERLDGPRRQVAEVADRRGDQHQRPRPALSHRRRPLGVGPSRSSTTSPIDRPHRSNAPASASITHAAFGTGHPTRWRAMRTVLTTAPSRVDVGDVEREAHPDRVHPAARREHQRALEAVPFEQPAPRGADPTPPLPTRARRASLTNQPTREAWHAHDQAGPPSMAPASVDRGPVRDHASADSRRRDTVAAHRVARATHRPQGVRVPGSILGNRVVRKEDPKFLTSGGKYLDDLNDVPELAGAAHVVYVRSAVAHGTITSIDTSDAAGHARRRSASSRRPTSVSSRRRRRSTRRVARTILASDRVRYVGEPIAAVVAETREQATDAAEAVVVDYDVLEAVVDPEDALSSSSTILYEAAGSNVVFDSTALGAPDLTGDEFFADCEVTASGTFVNQRVAPCPLEVRGSAAAWIDGRLHQWVSTQHAQGIKGVYVASNKLDADQVRVRTPDVGGGFGAKIGTYPEEIVLGALSKRARPPGALDRDPQRVDDRRSATAGPRSRRVTIGGIARRHGHALPAARHPGLRRVRRHGRDPRPVHDPADVVGRLRDPEHRVPHDVGRHQHDADRRLPRRRPARGDGGDRAGDGPVRRRDRHGPGRGAPHQPDRRRSASRTRRRSARPTTSATTSARSTACSRPPATTQLRAEQAAPARRPATRCSSASACRSTSRSPAASADGENAKIEVHDDGTATIYTGTSPHGQGHDTAWSMIASAKTGIPIDKFDARLGRHRPDAGRRRDDGLALAAAGRGGRRQGGHRARRGRPRSSPPRRSRRPRPTSSSTSTPGAFHVAGTPAVSKSWADLAVAGRAERRAADHRHPLRRRRARRSRSAPTSPSSRSTPRPARCA